MNQARRYNDSILKMSVPVIFHRFLARNGLEFNAIAESQRRRRAKQSCYQNAVRFALQHPGFRYCEGLAVDTELGFGFGHGWCLNEANEVVDPSLKAEDHSYFGVVVDASLLTKVPKGTVYYGLFDGPKPMEHLASMLEMDHQLKNDEVVGPLIMAILRSTKSR
jgi:hypothetical protein